LQTCVKTTLSGWGIGKAIHYNFFAPLNEKTPQSAAQEINYDFKYIPDEVTLLEKNLETDYVKR
jgi:hypothetical protein